MKQIFEKDKNYARSLASEYLNDWYPSDTDFPDSFLAPESPRKLKKARYTF